MKHFALPGTFAAAIALLLSACASTPQQRIERNPEMYASLDSKHQSAVRQGRIDQGMSRDAVYLAWGRPAGIKDGEVSGQPIEKWRYTGLRPMYVSHFGFGYGYGGYCDPYYYGGPSVEYVPYTNAVVEFRNGRVSRWERERR